MHYSDGPRFGGGNCVEEQDNNKHTEVFNI
jgi:hypothetical protein